MRGILKSYFSRKVLDRVLLAVMIAACGLYANHVGPSAPETLRVQPQSNLRCADNNLRRLQKIHQDFFVPTAPNEPMESVEN